MKKFVCEMCGSNDLLKQDEFYVCQNCGTKYTTEEAKKMMIEIDNSKKLANLYERARKSMEVDDRHHAAEYYKQILDENPNDWEAYFYSYLWEYTSYTNAEAASVATKLSNTIPSAYDMALANCSAEEATERVVTITTKVTDRLVEIASGGEYLLRQYEGGNLLIPDGKVKSEMYNRIRPTAGNTIAKSLDAFDPLDKKLEEIINNNQLINKERCKDALLYMRMARFRISDKEYFCNSVVSERLIRADLIDNYAQKVHECDPNFKVTSRVAQANAQALKQKQDNSRLRVEIIIVIVLVIFFLIYFGEDLGLYT